MHPLGLSLLVIVLGAGLALAGTEPADPTPATTGDASGAVPPQIPAGPPILYDQLNNCGTNATSSQNFEPAFDAFDDELADDFVVTGTIWQISQVNVMGVYFNGPGPAGSVNVRFYANAGNLPTGAPVCERLSVVPTSDTAGSFVLDLPTSCDLAMGTFWVSVQANMNFTPNGQWGWTDRTVQSNSAAAWQNPGGGFGVCTTWGTRHTTCAIDPGVPDQCYSLGGTVGQQQPNLTIDKVVDDPGPVISGDILTYTITVENIGNAAATNVSVVDPVPAMTTYVANSCTTTQGTCSLVGPNVVFQLGTMNPATMATLTFQVQVDPAPLPPGQICNQDYFVDSDQTMPVFGAAVCVDLVPVELESFSAGD